jgi:acylglycerol lipase
VSHAWSPDVETVLNSRGTALHVEHFSSRGPTKVSIVLVHGYSAHCGLYRGVGARLASHGLAVTQFDLRGHGRSEGARGHVMDFGDYVGDLGCVLGWARARTPNLPMSLMGHSMGATVALARVLDRTTQQLPDLLVLAAPWLKLRMKVSPPEHVGTDEGALALAFPNGMTGYDLSRNSVVRTAFDRDPLIHHVATMGWFMATLRAQARIQARANRLTTPTLMLLAGADRIVANEASQAFAERAGAAITVKTYEGLFHELYSEPESTSVLDDIAAWLLAGAEKKTA